MTKQQKTYLLLTATLIVWGIIGYQIFNRLNPKKVSLAAITTEKYTPQKLIEVTPYTINVDYRDPFLGKFTTGVKAISKNKKKKKKTKKERKKLFPKITYHGIIEGTSQSFVISINGNQETFILGQTINNTTLTEANSEKITMRFNDEIKTFTQQ